MVLSARFFVYTGILVTFCVIGGIRSHTISLPIHDKGTDYTHPRSKLNDTDISSSTTQSQNFVPTSLSSLTSSKKLVESSPVLNNFANNADESPPKLTEPTTIHRKTTLSSKKQHVVENPHELSVANVEKFVEGYFARKNRSALAEPTEAPSVKHILQVLSTEQSPPAGHTSKNTKVDDLIAIIPPGPVAAPLAAEKRRIALSAGNIIGIVIGVLVLMVGFIYVAMSYFPKARRRSSYTEMFINDAENEEEIALADYTEARADN